MRAIGQFTITNSCDVISSEAAPENPCVGQLWVNASASPPLTMMWNDVECVPQYDTETLLTTISVLTAKNAELQTTADGLSSYVVSMTEAIETMTNQLGQEQSAVPEMQAQMPENDLYLQK